MEELISNNKIIFPTNDNGLPAYKRHKEEIRSDTKPFSSIIDTKLNAIATKELRELFNAQLFDYSKTIDLIKQLINQSTHLYLNSTVLDFFSGSATTAHAVMQLNAEDGGHRKYIMVQLPELTDEKSEAYKAGYKNICEIGKERIRRAGRKIKQESPLTTRELDVGFRCLRVDSSNMKDVYYRPKEMSKDLLDVMEGNIKPDRTPQDLLFQVMLELGISLSSVIEETAILGKRVFNVDHNVLIACFDDNIDEAVITEIAKQKPYYFVMRDSGMACDSVSANFEQIFETFSRNTVRRVI